MKKGFIIMAILMMFITVIISPVLILLFMFGTFFSEDSEVSLELYCSGTGDYNMDLINTEFNSYNEYDEEREVLDRIFPLGVLSDNQHLFIKYAKQYKIDAVLMMAIAIHETGGGNSNAVKNYNNTGGLMSGNKLMKFPTLEKGIEAQARTLHNRIIKDKKSTILELSKVYAPIGAANDPNNLNQYWVDSVTELVVTLGGVKNCEIIGDISGVFVEGNSNYVIPTNDGFVVTSHFGNRIHPVTRIKTFHTGTDLACTKASPILAFADGVVKYTENKPSRWSTGLGNYIIVEHGGGLTTWYGHLETNTISVRKGQTVKAGQHIAGCGTTGTSTGYHLHFNVRLGTQYLDPYPYLTGAKMLGQ